MTRDGTVGRSDATEPNLAFHRDIDPVRMMRTRFADPIRASSPPGLHQQAGHMTASDLCAGPQQPKMLRLGFVGIQPREAPVYTNFLKRMAELGYQEGRNFTFD